MNFASQESKQKLRGGYYTCPDIATYLSDWVSIIRPSTVFEPSCGDGVFVRTIKNSQIRSLTKFVGFEIDSDEAAKSSSIKFSKSEIINTDFLKWYLFNEFMHGSVDAIVGNPPFIRYQYLPKEQQFLAEKIFTQLSLPFTKHTNAWVPFVLASIKLLRPGGRLAMVIPSEIFHIPHAKPLRKYLLEQCSRALLIDPEELLFQEALQGTVLLLAEKLKSSRHKKHGIAVHSVKNANELQDAEVLFTKSEYFRGQDLENKWMKVFLTAKERSLLNELTESPSVSRFQDLASVDVGIVTGANNFFLVTDSVVKEFGLEEWVHPMFGRSQHLRGVIHSERDQLANSKSGLPSNFLYFDVEEYEDLPQNVQYYIDSGVDQKLQTRFKCRTRKPWFKVPSVYKSPIAMLKRAHHFPRLVLNTAGAYSTDTAYRIHANGCDAESLVGSFVNSLTSLSSELEGRHYGGGVLELVPSEIERLLIPSLYRSENLIDVNNEFLSMASHEDFLATRDKVVLAKGMGLSKADCETLFSAWMRVRNRRQRK